MCAMLVWWVCERVWLAVYAGYMVFMVMVLWCLPGAGGCLQMRQQSTAIVPQPVAQGCAVGGVRGENGVKTV